MRTTIFIKIRAIPEHYVITVGRIKTQLVKRTGETIVQNHREKFSEQFSDNKHIIQQVADIPSKKLRNVVAGYVTRLVKR